MEHSIADWANLHDSILVLIVEKLVLPLSNYVRIRTVCKPWNLAISNNTNLLRKTLKDSSPLLIIPSNGNSEERLGLYNVIEEKKYQMELQLPVKTTTRAFCGSSHGWLAMFDATTLAITLINPFTSDAITLPLLNYSGDFFINKVVLSDDPYLNPKEYFVIALVKADDHTQIAIIRRPGDIERWAWINNPGGDKITDAIFRNGDIYAVDLSNNIISVKNFSSFDGTRNSAIKSEIIVRGSGSRPAIMKSYIVESSAGDILVIRRIFRFDHYKKHYLTKNCKVYKLVQDGTEAKLVNVESVRDDALFLGGNCSMSVAVTQNFPGCQPNCIYFTDDYNFICFLGSESARLLKPHDMGRFKLKMNGTMKRFYDPDHTIYSDKLFPIWILPTLKGQSSER
ncbi:probable F-box protein At1g65740 [Durio zibethinus]|uniref:Probable F-box protein At1g65740 n=1 Tax=Durio zibethinus TaxID=66656 RepID=A0A6P5ZU16_DURZI|nr:probable F-box protein At1g65740 [Durio zibethinus]